MSIPKLSNALHINTDSLVSEAKNAEQSARQGLTLKMGDTGKDGDRITLSKDAVSMSKAMQAAKGDESDSKTAVEQQIDRLKEQIEKLKEEIREKQQSDLPDEQKQQEIAQLQQQMMQYQSQLAELNKQQNGGGVTVGGTDAQGFANSLT
ncbi:hypothetical protein [Paucidesulfovibrio longus]|uniref:hypothetical protein n=1 Tax=Paucidesulfovibrio longus TaxID=889 RepID=UPI0003F8A97A|nr:hypothetical protein [Paucidesulfovibrio longus]